MYHTGGDRLIRSHSYNFVYIHTLFTLQYCTLYLESINCGYSYDKF